MASHWRALDDEGKFETFCVRAGRDVSTFPRRLLSFDPGNTTGWCVFDGPHPRWCGQLPLGPHTYWGPKIRALIIQMKPSVVVLEKFVLYSWKAKSQSWNDMYTSRVIGGIEITCQSLHIPVVQQTAGVGKPFCTDDKLKDWGLYQKSYRHADDAIRHMCYYLLFGAGQERGK